MITKSTPSVHRRKHIQPEIKVEKNWQSALAQAIRDPVELLRQLELPVSLAEQVSLPAEFPLRVTHSFLQRMEPGNPNDPLLRQVLPLETGAESEKWGSDDPVGDHEAMAGPGLLQKYHGRVLLVSTAACAVHCRYCFRQHFPYQQANPLGTQWPATLNWLKSNPDIREIILSGGDPLSMSDERLGRIIDQLNRLGHLRTLRIHTRLPVVLPQRIDESMLGWLRASRLNVVIVLHINHPNEINHELVEALARIRSSGVTLLNQAVLLRGINDHGEILIELSEKLFEAGVLPYYLHQLDRVRGAACYEVPIETGRRLVASLRERLPGYLVPRYVKEIPGQSSKSPIYG